MNLNNVSKTKPTKLTKIKYTYSEGVALFCKGCIHDNLEVGSWNEQVTCCTLTECPLYTLRPLPRGFKKGGYIDENQVDEVRLKVEGYKDNRRRRWRENDAS